MSSLSNSQIVEQLRSGGESALSNLYISHRSTLRDFIQSKISGELAARIDGSDVVQEAFLLAKRRVKTYVTNPESSFKDWLQSICLEALSKNHARHVTSNRRSVHREDPTFAFDNSSLHPTTEPMADPGVDLERNEVRNEVFKIIGTMKDSDREILFLKHVQEKSLRDAAFELQISYEAARKRYRRALQRLGRLARKLKLKDKG